MLARCYAANIVHHYIGCVLWGLGIVLSGGTMASAVVRQWFNEDIGKYTGIGGAFSAQIISPIINNGEIFGYRKAYLLSVAIALFITIVVLVLIRNNPNQRVSDANTGKKKARGQIWAGVAYEDVKRKPYFYLIFILIFLTSISVQSVGFISIVYMGDLGFSAKFVAATATVSSLALTFAKIGTGFTYDKMGLRFTLLLCQMCAIISFLVYANLQSSTIGMVFAMIATVLGAFALPLDTVMIPLITNELFGSASYSKVLGIYMAAISLGLCLGSPLCDIYRDLSGGSYVSCYWFFMFLMVIIAICFQLIIRTVYKDKEKILQSINDT